jgi:hypothetical protein
VYTYEDMFKPKMPQPFLVPYRAPSWSWACMDRPVNLFEGNDITQIIDITDC